MKNDFKSIYAGLILNNVKEIIKNNGIELDDIEKENYVDNIIISSINDEILKNKISDNFNIKELINNNQSSIITLVLYYTALYFDNVELLKKFIAKGFYKDLSNYNLDLYVLDNRISSKFNIDEYINMNLNYSKVFSHFYSSLSSEDFKDTNNEVINKFSYIINKKPEVLDEHGSFFINYLDKNVLSLVDADFILNLTIEQKRIITHLHHYDTDTQKRIINLIKKYNFNYDMIFWDEIFKVFTDEELVSYSKDSLDLIIHTFNNEIKYYVEELHARKIKKLKKEISKKQR